MTLDGSDRPTTLDAYGLDQYQERITMRRSHVGVATVCGVVLLGAASPAHAEDPTLNEKNCAGVATSGFAGPGFGATVGFFAQAQLVDNFGLAACGDAPRGNT